MMNMQDSTLMKWRILSEFRVKKKWSNFADQNMKKLTFSRHRDTGLFHRRHVQSTKGGRYA